MGRSQATLKIASSRFAICWQAAAGLLAIRGRQLLPGPGQVRCHHARQVGRPPILALVLFDLTAGEVVLQLPEKGALGSLPETALLEMKNYEYST